jgi:hypothetical protein
MRGAAIAVIVLALVSDAAAQQAAQQGRRTKPSTHEIAACLDAADQPICILRTLAPTAQRPYRDDPRFAHARDVLAAIGPAGATGADGGLSADALDREARVLYSDAARAVIAVLDADRNGAAPDRALARVRAIGQSPGSNIFLGAESRCWAHMEIWELFAEEDDRKRAGAPRPSEALARASVEACEAELPNVPRGHQLPVSMAQMGVTAAYAALGDRAGVERLMRRDGRGGAAVTRIRTALFLNDLDEAVAAALAPARGSDGGEGSPLNQLRLNVIGAARAAGRTEEAARIAAIILRESLATDVVDHAAPQPGRAAEVLALVGPPRRAVGLIERLDAAGRETRSTASLQNAHAAVSGWMALDESERARSLVDLWLLRAREEFSPRACDDEGSLRDMIVRMLSRTDRLDEAWDIACLQPHEAVSFDIEDGRGLARLDSHLSRARRQWDAEYALRQCAEWAPLALAAECARIFIARWGRRPLTREETVIGLEGPFGAAQSALRVADAAAEQGDLALMQRMLDDALAVFRDAPDVELRLGISELTNIAAMQLHAAGRT